MTSRPELSGTFGMVASTHWIGSAVGMSMLEKGGNAFDAAVAAGLTIEVVEPHLNGPGGDLPIIGWSAATRSPFVVCGQGPVPAAANIKAFRALGLDLIPGTGLLAACVPGAFGAWLRLLAEHGTLSLRDVISPAISYAATGFPVLPRMSRTIARSAELFRTYWPTSAAIWTPGGRIPTPGTMIRNPVLAATFQRILAEGEAASTDRVAQIEGARRAFYQGFVAESIDQFCQAGVVDGNGAAAAGFLCGDDLACWEASMEVPVAFEYAGCTVMKPGPWSQGPVLLQQLALLAGFDIAGVGATSADFVHIVTECAKLAFADREAYYGDPRFAAVPLGTLLSKPYNKGRHGLVGARADLGPLRPGVIDGKNPPLPHRIAPSAKRIPQIPRPGEGEPTITMDGGETGDTCHIDVVDSSGNMVSATPSGGWLQSSPAVYDLGFALGTRAQMCWLEPGLPNSLAPGKRPRTTLSPTLALRHGEPWLAFGTPGGDGQDQWVLQMFARHVHHGMDLQCAIETPTFQTEHFPSSFFPRDSEPGSLILEDRFPTDVRSELERRGHDVRVTGGWALGRVCAVSRDESGRLRAAADPRDAHCYAVGR